MTKLVEIRVTDTYTRIEDLENVKQVLYDARDKEGIGMWIGPYVHIHYFDGSQSVFEFHNHGDGTVEDMRGVYEQIKRHLPKESNLIELED